MNKMDLNLEYCHGISKLDHCFDFDNNRDFLLYAQNGSMKTSFYNTIYEYKNGMTTQDVFFPHRKTVREIRDENGNAIPPENVICMGNDDYDLPNDNISSLLVNEKLKKEYDSIVSSLDKKIKAINKSLKLLSGDTVDTLLYDLELEGVNKIPKSMLKKNKVIDDFKNLKYKDFFNKDFIENLQEKTVVDSINDYIDLCNEIIRSNPIFVKDVFELYNLKAINKSLTSNNYFQPGHLLRLRNQSKKNTYMNFDQNKLNTLIDDIDKKITQDEKISKVNQVLTSKIKTQELNVFLSKNQWIIPFLKDLKKLKKEYWYYILSSSQELIQLIKEYKQLISNNKKELNKILKKSTSKANYSNWNEAISIFNRKFINMPFELEIDNLSDVVLKKSACSLKYKFHDIIDTSNDVSLETLKDNLSRGERRAFNILNLIFEIQHRIKNNIETFIIIDDIADSFDYKNKYAIVELLKDLNDSSLFHLIIMTHNFDFYRICASSLSVETLSIIKDTEINFVSFYYKNNIFSTFKNQINKEIYFLASIPFVRNIIELTKGNNDPDYIFLTSTLHYKHDTPNILISQINDIFSKTISKTSTISDNNYLSSLFATADAIRKKTNSISLENKLCLSMAIRMKLEMFLFSKISSWTIVDGFTKNQTHEMITHCVKNNLLTPNEIKTADRVRIMASENIHVNAFMYEPIIDMSDDELMFLYQEVKSLK